MDKASETSFKTEKNINTFKCYLHGVIAGTMHIYPYCIYIYNFVHIFLYLFKLHIEKYNYHRICIFDILLYNGKLH